MLHAVAGGAGDRVRRSPRRRLVLALGKEMVYRCDPVDAGGRRRGRGAGRRRFLGGSYAVPVPAVPATALSEGVTPFGELFIDPGDPSFLWVRSDGVTERWLEIPVQGKLADPPTAQMIGDLILDGERTEVVAKLPDWSVSDRRRRSDEQMN